MRHVIERERIKREGQAEPLVDRSQLSMTAQQKLDAALRQYKQRLDADFSNRVNARVREFLQQFFLSTAGGRSKPNRAGTRGRLATRWPVVCEVGEQRVGAGVARSLRAIKPDPAKPLTHSHSGCHRFVP